MTQGSPSERDAHRFSKQDITFPSGDMRCAGWLFLPEGASGAPAIAMAHGLSAVKEMSLEPFAEGFAEAGFAVLCFDYRHSGASDGERGVIFPELQQEDYRSAITFLTQHPQVDSARVGIWGTSLSAGHVIQVAAHDRRVKAVYSQVPSVDRWSAVKRNSTPAGMARMLESLEADRVRRFGGEPGESIAITAPEDTPSLTGPDYYQLHVDWTKDAPSWHNGITLESVERLLGFYPAAYVDRLSPTPLMMVVALRDSLTPTDLALDAFAAAREPKELVLLDSDHYEIYDAPAEAIGHAVRFFSRWLVEASR